MSEDQVMEYAKEVAENLASKGGNPVQLIKAITRLTIDGLLIANMEDEQIALTSENFKVALYNLKQFCLDNTQPFLNFCKVIETEANKKENFKVVPTPILMSTAYYITMLNYVFERFEENK